MRKLLALILVLAAIAFMVLTWPKASPPGAGTPSTSPSGKSKPASPEGATPGSFAFSPRPAAPLATIPEHLVDPGALAPAPLPLSLDQPPFERREDGRILDTRVARKADDLNDEDRAPEEDLQILHSLVGDFRKIFKENPIAGENREVVAALTGRNAYNLMFIEPGHPAIRGGELFDRWETPYRFHAFSGSVMEFISAGPDRQFGTGDDITIDEPRTIGPPESEPDPGNDP